MPGPTGRRYRSERRRRRAAPDKKNAWIMAEAAGLHHGAAAVEMVEAGEGVGLQRAGEAGQVAAGMLARAAGGEAEHRDGGLDAAARPGVVGIDPEATVMGAGAAGIEHGDRGLVGMDLGALEQQ